MGAKSLDDLATLLISTAEERTIYFLGAGATQDSGLPENVQLPLANQLIEFMELEADPNYKKIESKKRPEELWEQIFPTDEGEKGYHLKNFLRKHFVDGKHIPRSYNHLIWLAREKYTDCIITTNFDEKLEESIIKTNQNDLTKRYFVVLTSEEDYDKYKTQLGNEILILKLHGTLSKTWTIRASAKQTDYLSEKKKHVFMEAVKKRHRIVFVGYRGEDSDVIGAISAILEEESIRKCLKGSLYWVSRGKIQQNTQIYDILKKCESLSNVYTGLAGDFFMKLYNRARGIPNVFSPPAIMVDNYAILRKRLFFPTNIADPIWGTISFKDFQIVEVEFRNLLYTSIMQKLNGIKQLTFVYLSYPGATHTRFSHSIGVAYLVSEALKKFSDLPNIDEIRKVGIISALLHDAGHGPFGHMLELLNQRLDPSRVTTHEEYGPTTLSASEVKSILGDTSIRHNELIRRMKGESYHSVLDPDRDQNYFLSQLIAGYGLDMDRFDFIIRDTIFTNFSLQPIKKFDIFSLGDRIKLKARLFSSMKLIKTKNVDNPPNNANEEDYLLCYDKKIEPIIRELLNLYVDLYCTVYYSHEALVSQGMIARALHLAHLDGYIDLRNIHQYDDDGILALLEQSENPMVNNLASLIRSGIIFWPIFFKPRENLNILDLEQGLFEAISDITPKGLSPVVVIPKIKSIGTMYLYEGLSAKPMKFEKENEKLENAIRGIVGVPMSENPDQELLEKVKAFLKSEDIEVLKMDPTLTIKSS